MDYLKRILLKYKRLNNFLIVIIIPLYILVGCEDQKNENTSKVEIRNVNGIYNFYVNDSLFEIKGVGIGFRTEQSFKALAAAGGNSFRTWSTDRGSEDLEAAKRHNLMVAMGISMKKELHGFDYTDSIEVNEQFERIQKEILKYKDHPNLLCWVVGNELNLKVDEDGNLDQVNPKAYEALDRIVKFIHKVDPYHPVTTTFAGLKKEHVQAALDKSPHLDFLSYQVYNDLENINAMEEKNGINMPYIITEYGPKGHWEMPKTSWNREIEENSTQKAEGLKERIEKGLISDPTGRNMGGYAFFWGQKQERTPTWYGMFNKDGRATAVVDELTYYWKGSYPNDRAPQIKSMTLDAKSSTSSIHLKPGGIYTAEVEAFSHDNDSLTFEWKLMKEVIDRSKGGAKEQEPEYVDLEIINDNNEEIKFRTPSEEGEFRLFCYIYDEKKVANANIPFMNK